MTQASTVQSANDWLGRAQSHPGFCPQGQAPAPRLGLTGPALGPPSTAGPSPHRPLGSGGQGVLPPHKPGPSERPPPLPLGPPWARGHAHRSVSLSLTLSRSCELGSWGGQGQQPRLETRQLPDLARAESRVPAHRSAPTGTPGSPQPSLDRWPAPPRPLPLTTWAGGESQPHDSEVRVQRGPRSSMPRAPTGPLPAPPWTHGRVPPGRMGNPADLWAPHTWEDGTSLRLSWPGR